jgi:hypothetical protein
MPSGPAQESHRDGTHGVTEHLQTDLFTAADHAILSPVRPAEIQRPVEPAANWATKKKKKCGAVL